MRRIYRIQPDVWCVRQHTPLGRYTDFCQSLPEVHDALESFRLCDEQTRDRMTAPRGRWQPTSMVGRLRKEGEL